MAETTTAKPSYVYVTYIRTTAENVWQALTDGEITRQFWGGQRNVNTAGWQVGSEWQHLDSDEPPNTYGVGKVLESDRPRRLVLSWAAPDQADNPEAYDVVSYDIAEDQGVVRLTVTNTNVEPGSGSAETWPKIMAGLKSLLETGESLPPFWVHDGDGFKMVRFG